MVALGVITKPDSLLSQYPELTGLQRILLTANGTVQIILSSFYNRPINVQIINNEETIIPKSNDAQFKREINLLCGGKAVCKAISIVTAKEEYYISLLRSQEIGLGQLFRLIKVVPKFELLEVGIEKEYFWRKYTLCCPGIECTIRENFQSWIFDLDRVVGKTFEADMPENS